MTATEVFQVRPLPDLFWRLVRTQRESLSLPKEQRMNLRRPGSSAVLMCSLEVSQDVL
jgi:hypothetical protein